MAKFAVQLFEGLTVLQHTDAGKRNVTLIYVPGPENKLGTLELRDGKPLTVFDLSHTKDIFLGKQTPLFLSPKLASVPDDNCFSICGPKEALNIEMTSMQAVDDLMDGLKHILTTSGRQVQDEEPPPLPPLESLNLPQQQQPQQNNTSSSGNASTSLAASSTANAKSGTSLGAVPQQAGSMAGSLAPSKKHTRGHTRMISVMMSSTEKPIPNPMQQQPGSKSIATATPKVESKQQAAETKETGSSPSGLTLVLTPPQSSGPTSPTTRPDSSSIVAEADDENTNPDKLRLSFDAKAFPGTLMVTSTDKTRSTISDASSVAEFPLPLEGQLEKRSPALFKGWQTRWFVLSANSLCYFKTHHDQRKGLVPTGCIPLSSISSVSKVGIGEFALNVPAFDEASTLPKTIQLRAANQLLRDKWADAIEYHVTEQKIRAQGL